MRTSVRALSCFSQVYLTALRTGVCGHHAGNVAAKGGDLFCLEGFHSGVKISYTSSNNILEEVPANTKRCAQLTCKITLSPPIKSPSMQQYLTCGARQRLIPVRIQYAGDIASC